MTTKKMKEMAIAACLSVIVALISGCAGTASPTVDVKTAGDSILKAQELIDLARSAEAAEFASQELNKAENLIRAAQAAIEDGNNREAADFAFQAGIEAKIATAMAQETKATRRVSEIQETMPRIMWEAKVDEAAAAKARQKIAEIKAAEANKSAKKIQTQAKKQMQKSDAELAVAKAQLQIDEANRLKATEYANEPYSRALSAIESAKSAIAIENFDEAMAAAKEASTYASTASVQARARMEAEFEESLRGRDKAVAAMTKAEISMERAKSDLAGHYAKDMYEKATDLLEQAQLALENRNYNQAETLGEQAYVAASSALAVAEAEVRETQVREAVEDAKANALDAVARAERSIKKAEDAGAEELAGDTYRKATAALQRAKSAIESEDFEMANSLAQESVSHSTTAFTMAEAKTARLKKIAEIENNIMDEAAKLPEVTTRKTNRGVVISMGGALFPRGSSQISGSAKARIKAIADILKKYPEYKVVIEGHTDSIGSDEANLKMSRERAYNFLNYMANQEGIPLERLSSVGYGESRPIASNINEAGRRQNRRVDIVILTAPISP